MRPKLPQFLKPPQFDNEDKTRAATVLHVILLALFVVLGLLAAITTHPLTVYVTAGMSLSYFGIWGLMRRGYVKLASRLLMGSLIIGITLIVYFNGSIRAPAVSGYVACIVVAGLTLSKRSTILWSIIVSLLLLALYQLEIRGLLPPVYYTQVSILQWATYVGVVCITAVMLMLAHTSILNALELARRNARSLEERNQELKSEIAERQQAEQALRVSEERYRTLFELEADAILLVELDTFRIVDANPAAEQLYGYSHAELLALNAQDLTLNNERVEAFGKGTVHAPLKYHCTKDGVVIPVETTSHVFFWQNKNMLLIVSRDITERVQTEEMLKKRLQALTTPLDSPLNLQFSDLFDIDKIQAIQDSFAEAVDVGSVVTDLTGHPITRPSNFCMFFPPEKHLQLQGKIHCLCFDRTTSQDHPNEPLIHACFRGGFLSARAGITVGGKHIANWLIGQVRTEPFDEAQIQQLSAETGLDHASLRQALHEMPFMPRERFEKIARALSMLANELSQEAYQNIQQARFITERKQMEAKLREHREHLEEQVQQRTTQLTAINQELEAFSYSVAHDLRSPLRAIDGFSRTLLEQHTTQLDEQGRAYLERIIAADQRMGQLIDDLLSLSRLNRSEMNYEAVDLSALARAILADLSQRHPQRQVEYHVADGLMVEADRRLISILLENLLGNAWKFTAKTPRARIEMGAQAGKPPTFYVRDNGAGFDMAYADKLFGAFQRLHTENEFPGTGIGLATVKRILHRHNGEVWAIGEVNQGATFYFTLPEQEG